MSTSLAPATVRRRAFLPAVLCGLALVLAPRGALAQATDEPAGASAPAAAAAASVIPASAAPAANPPAPAALDSYVVTATRTAADLRTLGSAVDVLTPDDLAREQIESPAVALGAIAGTPVFATGRAGADVSVFTRGSNSDQTLFLVDGIRFNDPNTDYGVYLGGARLGATDTVEEVRGPQSTLYGSEAAGGVISIRAQKGSGDPSADLQFEAGSFGTVEGMLDAQGARGPWAYALSVSGEHTDNQRANNDFDSGNVVLRFDYAVSDAVAAGATLRSFAGRYDDPGDIYTNNPYDYETESDWLGTVFADLRFAPDWTAHVTLGGEDRRYVAYEPDPGEPTDVSVVTNRRGVIDAQTTFGGLPAQQITAGFTGEEATTFDDGYGDIDQREDEWAVFAEDEWHPWSPFYVTGGLRHDDFDTFGSATTGRATAAWLFADRTLKVRASYGSGFSAPSFLELYGIATGYVGNPALKPERSHGGDGGIDYYLPGKRGTLSATWFRSDYRDLVVYDFSVYPGTTANVGRARTQGLELESKVRLPGAIEARVAYTYLEADDLTDQVRLERRPRNSGDADVWRDFGGGFSAGAGAQFVAGDQDIDALTYLTVNMPSYTVVRIYGQWRVSPRVALKARVENLLNRHYQPVNGYPALGVGVFGGVEWKL